MSQFVRHFSESRTVRPDGLQNFSAFFGPDRTDARKATQVQQFAVLSEEALDNDIWLIPKHIATTRG